MLGQALRHPQMFHPSPCRNTALTASAIFRALRDQCYAFASWSPYFPNIRPRHSPLPVVNVCDIFYVRQRPLFKKPPLQTRSDIRKWGARCAPHFYRKQAQPQSFCTVGLIMIIIATSRTFHSFIKYFFVCWQASQKAIWTC